MKSRLLYLIGGISLCLSMAGWAQIRPIPVEAQRGWLRHIQESIVSIDDKPVQLAPGSTIRTAQNLIVVPASLPVEGALAEFVLDASGQIARAWLLTAEEAGRQKPSR